MDSKGLRVSDGWTSIANDSVDIINKLLGKEYMNMCFECPTFQSVSITEQYMRDMSSFLGQMSNSYECDIRKGVRDDP